MATRICAAARARLFLLGICFAGAIGSIEASAITANQVDDFQSGTLQGWGGGSIPTNVATGGPAGSGDRYLEISAASSNLATFNKNQWAGNYQAAGVDRIDVHLNNFGSNAALSIRVMLFTPGCEFGPVSCTAWTSTTAQPLASGSGWVVASFSLAEADLTRVFGSASHAASLSNVERLLIRHDPGPPSAPGTQAIVTADLGIDNVLPEPSELVGLIAGVAALAASPRRRRPPRS